MIEPDKTTEIERRSTNVDEKLHQRKMRMDLT